MDYRIQQLRYQLKEDPASRYFFQLGELLRKQGEFAEAAEILEGGLEIHPRYVAAWVALGRTRSAAGDLTGAEEAFARALELDPEHGMAARLIGETAEARGDQVRAITAYKLARALLGPVPELDERIAELDEELNPGGPYQPPEPPVEVAFDEPDAGEREADPAADSEPAVAAAGDDDPFALSAEPRRPAPGADDVVTVSDGDPFAITATGHTGVFYVADDVFAAAAEPLDEPEPEPIQPTEPEPAPAPELEIETEREAGPEFEPAPEPADALQPTPDPFGPLLSGETDRPRETTSLEPALDDPALESDPFGSVPSGAPEPLEPGPFTAPEPAPASAAEFVDEPAPEDGGDDYEVVLDEDPPPPVAEQAGDFAEPTNLETGYPAIVPEAALEDDADEPEPEPEAAEADAADMPVPTLTLARLAWEQGDLPMAERTLEALLDRNPDDADAADFLELVRNRPRRQLAPEDLRPAKMAALQGWLQKVRLAGERRRA